MQTEKHSVWIKDSLDYCTKNSLIFTSKEKWMNINHKFHYRTLIKLKIMKLLEHPITHWTQTSHKFQPLTYQNLKLCSLHTIFNKMNLKFKKTIDYQNSNKVITKSIIMRGMIQVKVMNSSLEEILSSGKEHIMLRRIPLSALISAIVNTQSINHPLKIQFKIS